MRRHVEATSVTDARCKSGREGGGAQCRDEGCGQVVVLPTCLQIQGSAFAASARLNVAQLRRLALGFDPASTVYNRLDRLDAREPSYLNQPTTSLPRLTTRPGRSYDSVPNLQVFVSLLLCLPAFHPTYHYPRRLAV